MHRIEKLTFINKFLLIYFYIDTMHGFLLGFVSFNMYIRYILRSKLHHNKRMNVYFQLRNWTASELHKVHQSLDDWNAKISLAVWSYDVQVSTIPTFKSVSEKFYDGDGFKLSLRLVSLKCLKCLRFFYVRFASDLIKEGLSLLHKLTCILVITFTMWHIFMWQGRAWFYGSAFRESIKGKICLKTLNGEIIVWKPKLIMISCSIILWLFLRNGLKRTNYYNIIMLLCFLFFGSNKEPKVSRCRACVRPSVRDIPQKNIENEF